MSKSKAQKAKQRNKRMAEKQQMPAKKTMPAKKSDGFRDALVVFAILLSVMIVGVAIYAATVPDGPFLFTNNASVLLTDDEDADTDTVVDVDAEEEVEVTEE